MRLKTAGQRLDILTVLLVLIFVALVSRLTYLQVVKGPEYQRLAEGNRTRQVNVVAPRGDFFDRNGVVLVASRPGFVVSIVPGNKPVPAAVITQTAAILGIGSQEIVERLARSKSAFEPVRLKIDVGQHIVAAIEERRAELPGVVVEILPVRSYVHNQMGVHVFGYVSEISETELASIGDQGYRAGDLIGQSGLERKYDSFIKGIDGGSQIEVDVAGRMVQVLAKKEPIPGNNLVLTIDYRLQKVAEEALDEQLRYLQQQGGRRNAKAGAVVVLNPKNGEVLAMASRPAFDPNQFIGGISTQNWKAINENPFHPMDNRAIAGEYPPGSTFKIVTGTAALELKKVTSTELIFDSGQHWLVPKVNAAGEALGWINFHQALSMSDNVYFYEMGNRLGIDALERYARLFGLGSYTGIDLPGESDGLVANRKYKELNYKEDWYLAETFDAAIGQGFQLATPLQMAVLMSEIANGGRRWRPHIVGKVLSSKGELIKAMPVEEVGRIDISPETLKLVRDGLRGVSEAGGTGAGVFANFPVPVAGKTGTAENPHGDDHGWFVAYGPFDDPRLTVAVIIEQGGYGSSSAGPVARKILETAFNLKPAMVEAVRKPMPGTAL
ncbi:MAG: penicillin-binding protein 2 [Negativicutes bacterium]